MFFDVGILGDGRGDNRTKTQKKVDSLGLATEEISGIQHVDGDTFKDAAGEIYRFNKINTFESSPEALQAISPLSRANQINEASRLLGKTVEEVTIEDITGLGQIGKEAFERLANGDVRGVKMGKDKYGRTLVNIYGQDGESLQSKAKLGATGLDSSANNYINKKQKRIEVETQKKRDSLGYIVKTDQPSGYDEHGKPELQQRDDGLFNYGELNGIDQEAYKKMGRYEDERFNEQTSKTWASNVIKPLRGVANVAARVATGVGNVTAQFEKDYIERLKYINGDTLESKSERWNMTESRRFVDLDKGGYAQNVEITKEDIVAYRSGDEIQSFKKEALTMMEEEIGKRKIDLDKIEKQSALDKTRISKIEDYRSSDEFRSTAENAYLGTFQAILESPSNAINYSSQFFESLGQMAMYTNMITAAPMLAVATRESIDENMKGFIEAHDRKPNENELKYIAATTFIGEAIDGIAAFNLLKGDGKDLLSNAIRKLGNQAPKTVRVLPSFVKNMGIEFVQESATAIAGETAQKQKKFDEYDTVKIGEAGVKGAFGAGPISLVTDSRKRTPKLKKDKTAEAPNKKEFDDYVPKSPEPKGPTPSPSSSTKVELKEEDRKYTKISKGYESPDTTREAMTESLAIMSGTKEGDKGQAVYDLMNVISNAADLYGKNASAVQAGIAAEIAGKGKEIIAASEELTAVKNKVETDFGVVLGSLGSDTKLTAEQTSTFTTEEQVAIEAVETAISESGNKDWQRVNREVIEAGTKNIGIKEHLSKAVESGSISKKFTDFKNHMKTKSLAFLDAQDEDGTRYIKKGMGNYEVLSTIPPGAEKTADARGYKDYFTIHKGSDVLVQNALKDAKLVQEFYSLAEAVIVGNQVRDENASNAAKLKQLVIKSGGLDTDGKKQEEKGKGKTEKKKTEGSEATSEEVKYDIFTRIRKQFINHNDSGESGGLFATTDEIKKLNKLLSKLLDMGMSEKDAVEKLVQYDTGSVLPLKVKLSDGTFVNTVAVQEKNDLKKETDKKEDETQYPKGVKKKAELEGEAKVRQEKFDKLKKEGRADGKEKVQEKGQEANEVDSRLAEDIPLQENAPIEDVNDQEFVELDPVNSEPVAERKDTQSMEKITGTKPDKATGWVEKTKGSMFGIGKDIKVKMSTILNHVGFARASIVNLMNSGMKLGEALAQLSNDKKKNKLIEKLSFEFARASDQFINKSNSKRSLEYSFNNLLVQTGNEVKTPKEYSVAMATAFSNWMNASGRKTLTNDEHDVSMILYGEWESNLTEQEISEMAGIGTPLYMVAGDVGKVMANVLGVRVGLPKDGTKLDEAFLGKLTDQKSFEKMLGQMMLDMAEHVELDGKKLVTINHGKTVNIGPSTGNRTNKAVKDDILIVNTIKLIENKSSDNLIKSFNKSDKYFEDISGVQLDKKNIYTEGPKQSVQKNIPGSMSELPESRKTLIEKLQNIVWKPIGQNIDSFLNFTNEQQLELTGWIDPDTVHIDKRKSTTAKNNQITEQIKSLKDLVKQKTSKFWLGHYMMNQFRIMFDSNGVNPLSGKNLHRFMINPEKNKVTFKRGAAAEVLYKYSIVQALGSDIDKNDHQGVLDEFDIIVSDPDIVTAAKSLAWKDTNLVINNAHGLAGLVALGDWVNGNDEITTNLGIEVDGITNGYALGLMQFPNNEDGKLWSNLNRVGIAKRKGAYEENIDSVTDAYKVAAHEFILGLDQEGMLNHFESMVIAPLYTGELGPNMTITKEGRDLMKSPFMIFNYGASSRKATEGIAGFVTKQIYKNIMNLDGADLDTYLAQFGPELANKFKSKTNKKEVSIENEILELEKANIKNYTSITEKAFEPLTGSTSKIKTELSRAMDSVASGFAVEFDQAVQEKIGKLKMLSGYPSKINNLTHAQMKEVAGALVTTHYPFLEGAWNENSDTFMDMLDNVTEEANEQVVNAIWSPADAKTRSSKISDNVNSFNETGTRDQAQALADFLNKNGANTSWSQVKNSNGLKTDSKLDAAKVEALIPKNSKAEIVVPFQSTSPLSKFGYAHPGAKMLVRSIQNSDAAIMAKTMSESGDMLGLHDAIYTPITDIQKTVDRMNSNTIQTMRDYSIAEAVQRQYEKVKANIAAKDNRLFNASKSAMAHAENIRDIAKLKGHETELKKNDTRIEDLQDRFLEMSMDSNADSTEITRIGNQATALKETNDIYRENIDQLKSEINKRIDGEIDNFLREPNGIESEQMQKDNFSAWDAHYKENSKEQKDIDTAKKYGNEKPHLVNASKKSTRLNNTVEKNKADRVKLFEVLDNGGEVRQYYMPDAAADSASLNQNIEAGSLGSTTQDMNQDTIAREFIGTSTAEDISRINSQLDGNNSDINNIIDGIINPLMSKIGALTLNIKEVGSGFAEGVFRSQDNSIEMVHKTSDPNSHTFQTGQEVFAHELVHAVSWQAVNTSRRFREKLIRLRDSIKGQVTVKDFIQESEPSEEAKISAEAQYQAVFANENLQEFLAYGLTNPILVQKLKDIAVQERAWFEGNTWYDQAVNALVKAIEVIENIINKPDAKNAYEQLINFTKEVNGINHSKVSELASKYNLDKFYDRNDDAIKNFLEKNTDFAKVVGSKFFLKIFNLSVKLNNTVKDDIFDSTDTKFIRAPLNSIIALSKALTYFTTNAVSDKDKQAVMKAILSASNEWVNDTENEVAREMYNSITRLVRRVPLEIQKMLGKSMHEVEQARTQAKEMLMLIVDKGFGDRKPTEIESAMLTKVIGKTDLQSLLATIDSDMILELVRNEDRLDSLIRSERSKLKLDFWWNNQVEGLSDRMVNQKQDRHLVFDNVNTMAQNATSERKDTHQIDKFITLLALKKTKNKEELSNFLQENNHGFKNLLNTFRSLVNESAESFVGDKSLMTKGYIPRIADPHRSIQVSGVDNESRKVMESKGYKFQYNLKNYAGEQVGMYLATNLPMENQTKGMLSKTSKSSSHTSMMDKWKEEYNSRTDVEVRNYNAMKMYQQKKLIAAIRFPVNKDALRPVVNRDGDIVDFTIDMSFEVEESLLRLNMNISEVAGTMSGHTTDKVNSKEINAEAIDVLIQRQEDHAPNNEWEFINLMDASGKNTENYLSRLPYEARKKIEVYALENGGQFFVEEVWLDAIFGYENWTMSNLVQSESKKRKIRIFEEVVSGIVGIINNNIVIKTPAVWGGNFASNFVTSLISGLGPLETIKYWREGLSELRKYQDNAESIAQIDFKSRGDIAYKNANVAKRAKLVVRMNNNPTKNLVDAGLYNAITSEFMQTDEYSYKNKAVQFYDEKTKNISGVSTINSIVKGVYLAEDTSAYKSLLGMVQVSDFLGRYGIYKKMTEEKGKSKDEAYVYIQDMFVDFNVPAGRLIQYANSMGMILFYKYWSRIQRATIGMIKHHPTKSAQTLLMRSMLGMDINTIFNSGIITGGNFAPMGGWIDPVSMVKQLVTPSGIEIGLGLGDGIIGTVGALGTAAAVAESITKEKSLKVLRGAKKDFLAMVGMSEDEFIKQSGLDVNYIKGVLNQFMDGYEDVKNNMINGFHGGSSTQANQ